jgi:hypothetical protein
MRWLRGDFAGCDSLDIAAIWPASASVAGTSLPELNSPPANGEQSRKEEKKERL